MGCLGGREKAWHVFSKSGNFYYPIIKSRQKMVKKIIGVLKRFANLYATEWAMSDICSPVQYGWTPSLQHWLLEWHLCYTGDRTDVERTVFNINWVIVNCLHCFIPVLVAVQLAAVNVNQACSSVPTSISCISDMETFWLNDISTFGLSCLGHEHIYWCSFQ